VLAEQLLLMPLGDERSASASRAATAGSATGG
jgi:hypothetical protein